MESEALKNSLVFLSYQFFNKDYIIKIINNFTAKVNKSKCKSLQIFSDYYFENSKKNHVITYSIIPSSIDINALKYKISNIEPNDIKHVNNVKNKFVDLLNSENILNICFVMPNRRYAFFNSRKEAQEKLYDQLKQDLVQFKQNKNYNVSMAKSFEQALSDIVANRKIDIYIQSFMISFFGAYVASIFDRTANIDAISWISDRDKVNDLPDNFCCKLLANTFGALLENNTTLLIVPRPSESSEFLDELNRIPDYITGSMADLDLVNGKTTKDKFGVFIKKYLVNTDKNILIKLDYLKNNESTLKYITLK